MSFSEIAAVIASLRFNSETIVDLFNKLGIINSFVINIYIDLAVVQMDRLFYFG